MKNAQLTELELELLRQAILETAAAALSPCILVMADEEERHDFISRHCALVSQAMSAAGAERDSTFEEFVSQTVERLDDVRQEYFNSVFHRAAWAAEEEI
jgi:hypothetical protein